MTCALDWSHSGLTLLTDGEHVLTVRTRDYGGGWNFVGERLFVVDNHNLAQ